VRHNQITPHKHQIIHPYPRPILLTPVPAPRHIRSHFPRPLEKHPDRVAFFHAAAASRRAFAVEEGEGEHEVGLLDGFLEVGVLFAELVF